MWHTILVALLGIIASGCFYLHTHMSAHARASTLIYVNTPKLALNKAYHNLETVYYSNTIHWLSHLLKIACNEIRFKISMSLFQHKYFLFKKMCNFPFPLPNILLFGKLLQSLLFYPLFSEGFLTFNTQIIRALLWTFIYFHTENNESIFTLSFLAN